MVEEKIEDMMLKENSEEISKTLPKAQARNLEEIILPMYLPQVQTLATLYFLINRMILKQIMETAHQQSDIQISNICKYCKYFEFN